jgi:hypothetical protein
MRDQLEQRLSELRAEYESGQKLLADMETRQKDLRQMLLRISGAIQVLEEMLASGPAEADDAAQADDTAPEEA